MVTHSYLSNKPTNPCTKAFSDTENSQEQQITHPVLCQTGTSEPIKAWVQ